MKARVITLRGQQGEVMGMMSEVIEGRAEIGREIK